MIWRAIKYYFSQSVPRRQTEGTRNTEPVQYLDWASYLGRWYEIARLETPFEFGLSDVYAEYAAMNDDRISICNYGTDAEGKTYRAEAVATFAGAGQLRVAFMPFLHFISSLYRVLYVDDNYEHALVANTSGTCLWLLARSRVPSRFAVDEMLLEAEKRGFDVEQLVFNRDIKEDVALARPQ